MPLQEIVASLISFFASWVICNVELDKEVPNILEGVAPIPNPLTLLLLSGPKTSPMGSFGPISDAKDSSQGL